MCKRSSTYSLLSIEDGKSSMDGKSSVDGKSLRLDAVICFLLITSLFAVSLTVMILFFNGPRVEAGRYADASHGTREMECWVLSQDESTGAYLFTEPACNKIYRQIPTDWRVEVNALTPCWAKMSTESCSKNGYVSLAQNLPYDYGYLWIQVLLFSMTVGLGLLMVMLLCGLCER